MRTTTTRIAAVSALALGLAGCVSSSPNFDAGFGDTVRAARALQTRHPDATMANRDRPVDGIEGRAAREAMNRYYQSFAEPPVPGNVFNIGIGSGQGESSAQPR
jgi:hypothetical protein